jgi:biotin carboxyl carrier protein
MPGTILGVVVKVGDKVKRGDNLLILEAMKMENEIQAPADGEVLDIRVQQGTAVNAGDVLVVLS